MNSKYLILVFTVLLIFSRCKDDCPDDNPQLNCEGDMVQIDGECQCPENTARFALSTQCRPYSENDFWIQEGDECLGMAHLLFGEEAKNDIFDPTRSQIELAYSLGPTGTHYGFSYYPFEKTQTGYVIDIKSNILTDQKDFQECLEERYDGCDIRIELDTAWTTTDVTYKFWNDIDPSSNVKKEFGKELKAVFRNNTGPKER
jgi:hypothetical protein